MALYRHGRLVPAISRRTGHSFWAAPASPGACRSRSPGRARPWRWTTVHSSV